ncbi:carbohydrate ABC transporter permease [Oscillospiraceae bacterium PP1C4]
MKKNRAVLAIEYILLIFLGIFSAFPLLQVLINSFRTEKDLKSMPLGLPSEWIFTNFKETWVVGGYTQAFMQSTKIAAAVILIVLLSAGAAAYALTIMQFRGKELFIAYFFMAISIPGFLYIVQDYFIFNRLGLVNTSLGLIIAYSAMEIPFNLLLLRTFFNGIPKELVEAGKIDGCNEFSVFFKVIVPVSKPIFMTVALLVFTKTWNEFLWANTFITDDLKKTVALKFIKFTAEHMESMSQIYTASVITIVPVLVLYLVFQRNFIEGMTSGSVKG